MESMYKTQALQQAKYQSLLSIFTASGKLRFGFTLFSHCSSLVHSIALFFGKLLLLSEVYKTLQDTPTCCPNVNFSGTQYLLIL